MATATTTTRTLRVDGIGAVDVTFTERGQGRPFLLLHGGAGPRSVGEFADLLADAEPGRVLTPIHPGFDATSRPDALTSIGQLAQLYVALLDELGLTGVTVIGNSVGGWITAEMALLGSDRIASIVLIDAVGIEVPGHPVADYFSLAMPDVLALSFHDPAPFLIDPTTLPPPQLAVMAGNNATLAIYGGTPSMVDPGLRERLKAITVPTLVLWGDSDGIADPEYGRAYAQAIPGASFQLLTATGHVPQVETPDQVLAAIREFTASPASPTSR